MIQFGIRNTGHLGSYINMLNVQVIVKLLIVFFLFQSAQNKKRRRTKSARGEPGVCSWCNKYINVIRPSNVHSLETMISLQYMYIYIYIYIYIYMICVTIWGHVSLMPLFIFHSEKENFIYNENNNVHDYFLWTRAIDYRDARPTPTFPVLHMHMNVGHISQDAWKTTVRVSMNRKL